MTKKTIEIINNVTGLYGSFVKGNIVELEDKVADSFIKGGVGVLVGISKSDISENTDEKAVDNKSDISENTDEKAVDKGGDRKNAKTKIVKSSKVSSNR